MKIIDLQRALVTRNKTSFLEHCQDWTLADYSNAMCGEAGEVANEVKKHRRGDYERPEEFRVKLGKEIADVIAYALILANEARIDDIEYLIVAKFNEVSDRCNSDLKLTHELPEFEPGHLLTPEEIKPGMLVRYGTGNTALVRVESPHAGGWHGRHCCGGVRFVSGRLYAATKDDHFIWANNADWRI